MSLLSKVENPIIVKPGDVLFLGKKYDVVNTKYVSLDRTSQRPVVSMQVPKDAPEDMMEHLQDLFNDRVLTKEEPEMSNLRKEPVKEFKSFSTRQIEEMSFSELRFAADKLNVGYSKEDSRATLREKLYAATGGKGEKKTRGRG